LICSTERSVGWVQVVVGLGGGLRGGRICFSLLVMLVRFVVKVLFGLVCSSSFICCYFDWVVFCSMVVC